MRYCVQSCSEWIVPQARQPYLGRRMRRTHSCAGSDGDRTVANPHRSKSTREGLPVCAVIVAQQIGRRRAPRECLPRSVGPATPRLALDAGNDLTANAPKPDLNQPIGASPRTAGDVPQHSAKKTGTLTVQSWDRVKGTKRTRVMERIRVSLGAIFSTTVSCCGASMDPSGMTSRPPTLSCSINGGGTCPSAAVTTIASKGPHSNHP